MNCFTCKGEMKESTTTFFSQLENCMLIVKNVPCFACNQCGEELFNGNVIERLEKLMDNAEILASDLLVIEYNKVA